MRPTERSTRPVGPFDTLPPLLRAATAPRQIHVRREPDLGSRPQALTPPLTCVGCRKPWPPQEVSPMMPLPPEWFDPSPRAPTNEAWRPTQGLPMEHGGPYVSATTREREGREVRHV